jgi:hypothetical protein
MSKIRGAGQNKKGYNSFSGVDIKAVFGNTVIGELQAISYSVSREKAPLYTMGSADCRAYSRGKRGIAGTLIFLMFDRHAFLGHFGSTATSGTDIPAAYQPYLDSNEEEPSGSGATPITSAVPLQSTAGTAGSTELQASTDTGTSLADVATPKISWFSDQVLPFDVTLAAANEYGALALMRIYGCEILNEGYGVSIDDIVSEQQMSYVARTLMPWTSVER